jgi:hypothetical protein
VRAKALADKADKRRRQDALAAEQCRLELAERAAAMAESALAEEGRHRESAECAAATVEKILAAAKCLLAWCVAKDQRSAKRRAQAQEAAKHAKALAAQELAEAANECHRHEAAAHAKALAAQELAVAYNKHNRHEAAAHATALAAKVLAGERGGQESAVRAKVFAVQALAIAPSLPPRPTSYAGAVLSTLGGSLLPAVPLSPPLPTTGSPLQMVCQRVQPCRCTGHCNHPCAPSPINEALI